MNKEVIRLDEIRRDFRVGDETVHALRGVSFTIREGEFVTIMGTSGSGKSTLLNILGILDDYDSGSYYLAGRLIKNLTETQAAAARNRMIGYIFQSFNLISYKNAMENVALPLYYQGVPRRKRNAMALEYLDTLGLRDWAGHMPNEMSGGQKQRVAIARMLTKKTPVMVFDDSLSAVDTQTDEHIREALNRDLAGTTTIIISHRITTLMDCDNILVLEHGKVLQRGTPQELLRQPGLFRQIYDMQMSIGEEEPA